MVTQLVRYWTYRMFAPGSLLQATHKSFQSLLAFDTRSHELMAELEGLYYRGHRVDFSQITLKHEALITNVTGMVTCLEQMAPGSHPDLAQYLKKLSFYSRFFLAPPAPSLGCHLLYAHQGLGNAVVSGTVTPGTLCPDVSSATRPRITAGQQDTEKDEGHPHELLSMETLA